ncbi:hypothetical protein CCP3SC15_3210004 [Gammaproteobacteria bacterium]
MTVSVRISADEAAWLNDQASDCNRAEVLRRLIHRARLGREPEARSWSTRSRLGRPRK